MRAWASVLIWSMPILMLAWLAVEEADWTITALLAANLLGFCEARYAYWPGALNRWSQRR